MEQTELVLYSDRDMENSPSEYIFTDVLAGDKRTRTVFLRNETNDEIIDIEYISEDLDAHLTGLPKSLRAGASKFCKIVFTPDIDRITSLNSMYTIYGKQKVPTQPKKQEMGI